MYEVGVTVLTKREKQVVNLLAQGMSQNIIARQLEISRFTVYNHVKNIRQKTGATSAFEVAVNTIRQCSQK